MMSQASLDRVRRRLATAERVIQDILEQRPVVVPVDPDVLRMRLTAALKAVQAARQELPAREKVEYSA